jgi:hypothetical protein
MKKKGILFFAVILTALMLSGCPGVGQESEETPNAPAVPMGIKVTSADSQLTVSWQAVTGADNYEVKWEKLGEESSNTKKNISGISYTISDLENGTTYSIEVRAKNVGGTSEWSEAKEGTPKKPISAPDAPSKPIVTSNGAKLTVEWAAVEGATIYQVFYDTSPNPTSQYEGDISGTSVEITVSENGTYYVRIKAGNSIGYSGYSSADSAVVTLNGTPSVIGSWKSANDNATYTFAENGKLTRTSTNGDTAYYFYDSAAKEFYRGTRLWYTLSGNSLTISSSSPFNGTWTSSNNKGIVGTWTKDGDTMEITADTITIGSDTYPYYTHSEESQYLVYKPASAELYGRYALSGGKLQLTTFSRSTYQREGTGSEIVGTWKSSSTTWTFNLDGTAIYTWDMGKDGSGTSNYLYNKLSGSNKISMEQEWGTLSGNTLTISDMGDFSRKGSGSGIIGSWTASLDDRTLTLEITQDKVEYTQTKDGKSESQSASIRIAGNKIYLPTDCSYKIVDDTLTLISEYTRECSRQ